MKDKVQTSALPKVDKDIFIQFADENGKEIFNRIFNFIDNNKLHIRWGSKGFSVNYQDNDGFVGLFTCYPEKSVFKQSIYTGYDAIEKKIKNSDEIIDFYKTEVKKLEVFQNAQKSEKWIINKNFPSEKIDSFLELVKAVIVKVEENGWK